MKILLVTLRKRAGSDAVSKRETLLEGGNIHVGRAVSMEVNLPDIDVDYHHATLTIDGGRLKMHAESEGGLTLGRKSANEADLSGGDVVTIGRFTFKGEPGRDGAEAVVVLEEEPATVAAPGVRHGSRRVLEQVLPSRRLMGWVFSLVILGVFLIWPLTDVLQRPGMQPDAAPAEAQIVDGMVRTDLPHPTLMEAAWSSGPLSDSHALLNDDCAACHERPFERVADTACLACHAMVENHAAPDDHPAVALGAQRCASCHAEHNGGADPTEVASIACTNCHSDIKAVSADSELPNIYSFTTGHPVFQLSVITGVAHNPGERPRALVTRTMFNPEQPPTENTGLKFPHDKHLVAGLRAPDGQTTLLCADCHQLEPGGKLMREIDFDRDCSNCHKMEFDAGGVIRPLPHGEEDEIARVITEYFLSIAVDVGVSEDAAVTNPPPAAVQTKRRRRITLAELEEERQQTEQELQQLTPQDRRLTVEWAEKETLIQMDAIFGVRLCANCHEAQKFPEEKGTERWRVMPAVLQRHWMPKAEFDHTPHMAMDCTGCHDATTSSKSSDVLMPDFASCKDCHVEGELTAGIVCTSCHEYHVTGRAPMSLPHAQLFGARAEQRQRAEARGGTQQ